MNKTQSGWICAFVQYNTTGIDDLWEWDSTWCLTIVITYNILCPVEARLRILSWDVSCARTRQRDSMELDVNKGNLVRPVLLYGYEFVKKRSGTCRMLTLLGKRMVEIRRRWECLGDRSCRQEWRCCFLRDKGPWRWGIRPKSEVYMISVLLGLRHNAADIGS